MEIGFDLEIINKIMNLHWNCKKRRINGQDHFGQSKKYFFGGLKSLIDI